MGDPHSSNLIRQGKALWGYFLIWRAQTGTAVSLPTLISVCFLQHVSYRHGDHWPCLYTLLHCVSSLMGQVIALLCFGFVPFFLGPGHTPSLMGPETADPSSAPAFSCPWIVWPSRAIGSPAYCWREYQQVGRNTLCPRYETPEFQARSCNPQGYQIGDEASLYKVGAKRIPQLPFFLCLFVHACMSTYVFTYAHMFVCASACLCSHAGQMVSLVTFFALFFEIGLSLSLEVPISSRLAHQQAPAMLLAPPRLLWQPHRITPGFHLVFRFKFRSSRFTGSAISAASSSTVPSTAMLRISENGDSDMPRKCFPVVRGWHP